MLVIDVITEESAKIGEKSPLLEIQVHFPNSASADVPTFEPSLIATGLTGN